MRIFQEKPKVIGDEAVWVCIHDGYLYTANTLEELVEVLNTEWEHDKHLVRDYWRGMK